MSDDKKYKAEIIRGAQYLLPIVIKQGETVITSENADGVKVCVDTAVATYPNGGLTFEDGVWYYPITQDLSLTLEEGEVDFQIQVKIGTNVLPSKVQKIKIGESIIEGTW